MITEQCLNLFPAADRTKDAVMTRLSEAITDQLQQQWLDHEPGQQCFDLDETRTADLLSFIAGTASAARSNEISAHLADCARCQFLYTQLSKETPHVLESKAGFVIAPECIPEEPIPNILRDTLRGSGSVVFPSGELADGAWEFGRLLKLPTAVAENLTETIAERAWRTLRSVLPRERVVIVCFSSPVHRFGKRLASKMVEANLEDVHVVMADDFYYPKLWCDPKELRGRNVVVFADVVHSGGLLGRLYSVCQEAKPASLCGLTVIDQSYGKAHDFPLYTLWRELPEERKCPSNTKPLCPDVRFFDPEAALAHKKLPLEVANPVKAKETIETYLAILQPIRKYITVTHALRQDVQIGGVHYPWAIDLLRLLRDDDARAELVCHAKMRLRDLAERGRWCLVYPAPRMKRAGKWAELVADEFDWPVVKLGLAHRTHYRPLTCMQLRALAKCPRVMVIDAAIRTGKTLESLVGLLRTPTLPQISEIKAFYAFDGLFDEGRAELQRRLDVEVRSLFQLPLGAPTEPVGRHCIQQIAQTLAEISPLPGTGSPTWAHAIRSYCTKKLTPVKYPFKQAVVDASGNLHRAIDEGQRGAEARLEHACDPPRASLVKHLDVGFALREPRIRNVLHGFLCNSMPVEFIEWCALALATQRDFDWLDRDWLLLHKRLFTHSDSDRWQFLACICYWAGRHGDESEVRRIQHAIGEFQASVTSPRLFPELAVGRFGQKDVGTRCEALQAALAAR